MKNKLMVLPQSTFHKTRTSIGLLVALLFMMSGCATKYAFLKSPIVPAATGVVKVSKDKNSNFGINLSTIQLADPQQLTPSMNYYVAWVKTEGSGSKNIGQLKTSRSMFSKTMKSSLKTVTSFKPTGFFITAENDENVQTPGEQIILKTNN